MACMEPIYLQEFYFVVFGTPEESKHTSYVFARFVLQLHRHILRIPPQLLQQGLFALSRRLRDSNKGPFVGLAHSTLRRQRSSLEILPDVLRHAQIGRADHAVAFGIRR